MYIFLAHFIGFFKMNSLTKCNSYRYGNVLAFDRPVPQDGFPVSLGECHVLQ